MMGLTVLGFLGDLVLGIAFGGVGLVVGLVVGVVGSKFVVPKLLGGKEIDWQDHSGTVDAVHTDVVDPSSVETDPSTERKAIATIEQLHREDESTSISGDTRSTDQTSLEIDPEVDIICRHLNIDTDRRSTKEKIRTIKRTLQDWNEQNGDRWTSDELVAAIEDVCTLDNDILVGFQKLETDSEAAKERFRSAAESIEAYHHLEDTLRKYDSTTARPSTAALDTIDNGLHNTDGTVARSIRAIVGDFKSCRESLTETEAELEKNTEALEEVESRLEGLEQAVDQEFRSSRESYDTEMDGGEKADWLAQRIRSGTVGRRNAAIAAQQVLENQHPPPAAKPLAEKLAASDEHSPETIQSELESVLEDLKEYTLITDQAAAEDTSVEAIETAVNRIDAAAAAVSSPIGEIVLEHARSRQEDARRLGDNNVLGRYAIKTEIEGVETILDKLRRSDPVEVSASLESVASGAESEIESLKRRRDQQRRFGRANVFVDHYIELAEEFHQMGIDALETGEETAASERFDAATKVVTYTHDMYEGDKKKLLARAAGLAE